MLLKRLLNWSVGSHEGNRPRTVVMVIELHDCEVDMTKLGEELNAAAAAIQADQAKIADLNTQLDASKAQVVSLQAALAAMPPVPALAGDADDLAAANNLATLLSLPPITGT